MRRLTEDQIKQINSSLQDKWNQGIYKEPFGVEHEKDYVIFQRHESGGMRGGGYHDNDYRRPYVNDEPRPNWEALDSVLKILCPDISYLRYKEIENMIVLIDSQDNEDYYGNYDEYDIWYLPLETLYKYLGI